MHMRCGDGDGDDDGDGDGDDDGDGDGDDGRDGGVNCVGLFSGLVWLIKCVLVSLIRCGRS